MNEYAVAQARGAEEGPARPALAPDEAPPLSIGLYSAGWPPDACPNGVVTYVAGLAEGLEALGHRVTIITPTAPPGDWGDAVYVLDRAAAPRGLMRRAADWLWYRLASEPRIQLRAARELAAGIRRAVAERGVEVLEMEETRGAVDLVRQAVGIPVTVRLQGPWFVNGPAIGAGRGRVYRWRVAREEVAIGRALAVTASSSDVLERTRRHYGMALEHAEVIPTAIRPVAPADRWRRGDSEPATVLFAGRFDRHKGGDLMIRAFARVLGAVPEARLLFAGPDWGVVDDDGRRWDLAGFVDDRIPGARASGRVQLLGQQPRSALDGLRRRAAVTVICSRYDNFPATVLEAAAMGCPIVAARIGGIPEIIRDGVDGLLHTTCDVDDLADQIIAMLTEPDRAAEFGRQAAARCEREFHPIAVAERMVAHFRRTKARAAAPVRAG